MRALVTGAAGFLGRALVERLAARGEVDLALFARPGRRAQLDAVRARLESSFPTARFANRLESCRIDVREGTLASAAEAARAVEGVDVIYHLAARMNGTPAEIFGDTVVASKHLLEGVVAAQRPIRLVLVSSLSVYGVAELGRGARVDESTPLETRPAQRDLYAQAKLRQERLFHLWHAAASIARVCWAGRPEASTRLWRRA